MKKFLFRPFITTIILLLVYKTGSYGQAMMRPYWMCDNHYLTDRYLINPAFAGYSYYPKIFVGAQRMEIQHPEAPSVHMVGFHSRLGIMHDYYSENMSNYRTERNSIGGLLFTDRNGPYHTTGIKLDYVYSVPLDRFHYNILSFGLGGILIGKSIKLDKNILTWLEDPFVAANIGNKMTIPDFNAGILFSSHDKFYMGLSVSQILENSDQEKFTFTIPPVYRNYYFLTGYRFEMNWLHIEPSVTIGHNLGSQNINDHGKFVDINLELSVKPVVLIQSYRLDGYITSALLYRAKRLEMGARAEWFSFNASNAHLTGVALTIAYTFAPKFGEVE